MKVYLFERLFNLGNNYARMRSCQVEGHLQIAENVNKMCQNLEFRRFGAMGVPAKIFVRIGISY